MAHRAHDHRDPEFNDPRCATADCGATALPYDTLCDDCRCDADRAARVAEPVAFVDPDTSAMVRRITVDCFARREADAAQGVPMDGDLCDALTSAWMEAVDRDPLAWFTPVLFVGESA